MSSNDNTWNGTTLPPKDKLLWFANIKTGERVIGCCYYNKYLIPHIRCPITGSEILFKWHLWKEEQRFNPKQP